MNKVSACVCVTLRLLAVHSDIMQSMRSHSYSPFERTASNAGTLLLHSNLNKLFHPVINFHLDFLHFNFNFKFKLKIILHFSFLMFFETKLFYRFVECGENDCGELEFKNQRGFKSCRIIE